MTTAEDVRQKLDIVEVIGEHVSLTKSGKNFRGLCPFHSEKTPSFFVFPERQSWHCFGACATGGDVFAFVMKKEGVGFGEALRFLAEKAGVSIVTSRESEAERQGRERLYQVTEAAAKYFYEMLLNTPAGEKARNYLTGRGLSIETMMNFQLGYSLNNWEALKQYLTERGYTEDELLTTGLIIKAEDGKTHDRFRNKIMFPICDIKGRVTGFGSRVLDDSLPKYINSPQTPIFDKSASLYGINRARSAIREKDLVIIVEGYIDVLMAHQCGFTNVIASMGTSMTEKQLSTLQKFSKNLVLALDPDAAGEEAMLKGIGYENSLGAEVRVMTLPPGKDPDEVIREDVNSWRNLLGEAVPVIDYAFNIVLPEFDLTTAKGKSLAAERLLPIISGIADPVRKAFYLQKLSRLIGVSVNSLETALRRLKRIPVKSAKTPVVKSLFANPPEEYCLALLLQHPGLSFNRQKLPPEYFEDSENREIYLAYLETEDIQLVREKLDIEIREHLDSLIRKSLPPSPLEPKLADCILNLREKFLRNLEAKRAAVLALEAEAKGASAALARLKEEGIDANHPLKEVFDQGLKRWGKGGKK